MNTKKIHMLILVLLLCLGLCGCDTFDNFRKAFFDKDEDDTPVIKIGVFEPLNGSYAEAASREIEGIKLANSMYGAVLNSRIELVYADNQSDANQGRVAASTLIDEGVSVVIGSYSSVLSLAAEDIFSQNKMPTIMATCTNPIITQTSDYHFRVCYIDSYEGTGAAAYLIDELKIPSAAILVAEGHDYDISKADAFEKAFAEALPRFVPKEEELPEEPVPEKTDKKSTKDSKKKNEPVEPVADPEEPVEPARTVPEHGTEKFTFNDKDTNWDTLFASIYDAGYDVIYMPSDVQAAQQIIDTARNQGYDFLWIGTNQWEGITTENAVYTAEYGHGAELSTMTQAFLKAYDQLHPGQTPTDEVALGFDAYMLIRDAVSRAGTDANSFQYLTALSQVKEMNGATGSITMSTGGDPIKDIIVEQYKDGDFSPVYTIKGLETTRILEEENNNEQAE